MYLKGRANRIWNRNVKYKREARILAQATGLIELLFDEMGKLVRGTDLGLWRLQILFCTH